MECCIKCLLKQNCPLITTWIADKNITCSNSFVKYKIGFWSDNTTKFKWFVAGSKMTEVIIRYVVLCLQMYNVSWFDSYMPLSGILEFVSHNNGILKTQ